MKEKLCDAKLEAIKKAIKKEKTKTLFVRVPESSFNKVNEIAEKECRTQVSIVRQAIKEFLSNKKGG